jgi:hypothetical protein
MKEIVSSAIEPIAAKGAAMSHDPEGPLEETGVLDHLFGVWYPKYHVVGVVEDRDSADRAADALRTAWRDAGGPEDAVWLFHAEDGREAIRRTEGFYGPAKRGIAALSRGVGSEESVADLDYRTAINQGHNVLAVLTPRPEAVERARAVLANFDVQHLRYYGSLALTDFRTNAMEAPRGDSK